MSFTVVPLYILRPDEEPSETLLQSNVKVGAMALKGNALFCKTSYTVVQEFLSKEEFLENVQNISQYISDNSITIDQLSEEIRHKCLLRDPNKWTPEQLRTRSIDLNFSGLPLGKISSMKNHGYENVRFTQNTLDRQPEIIEAVNGYRGAKFNSGEYLLSSGKFIKSMLNTISVFFVGKAQHENNFVPFDIRTNRGKEHFYFGNNSISGLNTLRAGLWSNGAWHFATIDELPLNEYLMAYSTYNGNVINLHTLTDNSSRNFSFGNTNMLDLTANIGRGHVNPTHFSEMIMLRLIVFIDSVPNRDDFSRLEGWAAHKYGISLPDNHPYKLLPPMLD